MGRMEGKVVFITGAGRGQGRSHAVRLAGEGADIVGIDICENIAAVPYDLATEADLAETKRLVEETGRRMLTFKCDVRDHDGMKKTFDQGVAEFGHIDTVVANAGIVMFNTHERDNVEAWEVGIGVMLSGVRNALQVAYPHMVERGQGGCFILTSSSAALLGKTTANGGDDAYGVAKLGVIGLAQMYANYLGRYNIRVNAIAPTGVQTPMMLNNPEAFPFMAANAEVLGDMTNLLPVEMITAADVSETVLFLADDATGRYFTGGVLKIDAGLTAK
ncbi:SDR family mycofactocin-dependent oxidoreductase [Actinocorallia herbida]|uniref:SDR family mycofactocin-dependent oxidoreductase n=1 Tax=Actinocorallia herbida TaxID=58109 RepID=A0A3N1D3B9_9ACTN|nr:mycofactocin-coupled SDR family oxidoreductase [Actinocorallia herbida]ROO88000.1 SDR family mycofactocin-dependent oxidoreductase [Actinocorallia herbida]